MTKTHYTLGNEIRIPCAVEGYPSPQVTWYLNDELIDLAASRRVRYGEVAMVTLHAFLNHLNISYCVSEPPDLEISESQPTDSGTYRCEATNEYAQSSSSVMINVEGHQVNLHPNCTDNSFFANCKLIVKANYCTNKYYARFCCKSCTLAGQLPTYGPHLNEVSQAYFRGSRTQTQFRGGSQGRSGLISDSNSNDRNELFN